MDTKTCIIQAAVWLFLKHGYDSVSVSDIASRAEVSKGGLYHHFNSKQTLAGAVVDIYTREFYLRVKSSIENQHSTLDQLKAVFQLLQTDQTIWATNTADDPAPDLSAVLRFLFEVARDNNHLREQISQSHDMIIQDFQKALESGKKLGYVRGDLASDHTAVLWFTMHRGLQNLWAFNPGIDVNSISSQMADDLWRLIKA